LTISVAILVVLSVLVAVVRPPMWRKLAAAEETR
jgi:hypothetical protein